MAFIKWFGFFCFALLCLLSAEDECIEVENSIREGEFEMPQVVSHEQLSERSFAVVYADGGITLNDESMGVISLSADEAYNLLEVLYRYSDVLRGKQDTVPLPGPAYDGHVGEEPKYAPRDSNYHDHRCSCPGCNYDGPEPTPEECQRIMAEMGPEPPLPGWARQE